MTETCVTKTKADGEKFKDKKYWEKRYETEEDFDWFCELAAFEHLLFQYISQADSLLNLGCGNSSLSASLCKKGYHNIINIDFSETVISKMRERASEMPSLKWIVMDMLDLKFDSGSFDVVLDKGSIDSLMVDQGSVWNPRQEVIRVAEQALREAFRVLKVGGRFISVTFSQPHFRGPLLYQPDKFAWSLTHQCFGEGFHYFFFVATKRESKEEVVRGQSFDYSYPSLYKKTQENYCGSVGHESNSGTLANWEVEDENYLMNIGDVIS